MQTGLTFYLNGRYVYCQYYAETGRTLEERRLQVSAGLRVDPALYPDKLPKHQRARMTRLKGRIDEYEAYKMQGGERTRKDEVEAIILDETGKRPIIHRTKETFYSLYSRYLEKVRAGEILRDGKKAGVSWLGAATSALGAIKDLPIGQKSPADITVEDIMATDALIAGREVGSRKLARNTVALYMVFITNVLSETRALGWHKGERLVTKGAKSTAEDIDHGVYITENEQKVIRALTLKGKQAEYRDAIIFGCQVGMRYSDLSRITPKHRRGDLLNINTRKTGKEVWVPLNAVAGEIWKRYKGKLNVPAYTDFQTFIRWLGHKAGMTQPTLFSRTEGGTKQERWVKKWELLGTHSMRRSFATNAYKAGVPMPSIMKVTGHKSTVSFLKYIRLSDEEHATLLSNHPYFKS